MSRASEVGVYYLIKSNPLKLTHHSVNCLFLFQRKPSNFKKVESWKLEELLKTIVQKLTNNQLIQIPWTETTTFGGFKKAAFFMVFPPRHRSELCVKCLDVGAVGTWQAFIPHVFFDGYHLK